MAADPLLDALADRVADRLLGELRAVRGELAALREAVPTRMVSPAEAAEMLGVAERTVRRWIAAGRLPVVRVGRTVRIEAAALRAVDLTALARRARGDGR
jgi:excisionase family DNA binding protein